MNFMMITNMNSFLNMSNLQCKWNEKAKNPMAETEITGNSTKTAGILRQVEQMHETQNKDRAGQMYSKLVNGGSLSPAELEYMRTVAPDLYNSAVRTMAERKAYEEALRQCETKDDVNSLHMSKIASVMGQVKDAMARNDLPACIAANNRMNALSKVMTDYSRTAEFRNLANNQNELREAREAERKEREGEIYEGDPVEETTDTSEAVVVEDTGRTEEAPGATDPENAGRPEHTDSRIDTRNEKPERTKTGTKKKQIDPELVKKAKRKTKSSPVAQLYATFLSVQSTGTEAATYTGKA